MRQSATIIVPPPATFTVNGRTYSNNARKFHHVDQFAEQLSKAARFDVPIIEGSITDAPKDGYIFLYDDAFPSEGVNPEIFFSLGPRIILLLAGRGQVMSGRRESLVCDVYNLAAAVEGYDYFTWQGGPGHGRIYGLVSVAEKAELKIGLRVPISDYGFLYAPHQTIGDLFVRYLTVYEEMGMHLRMSSAEG